MARLWRVTQGTSTCKVRAESHAGALERAALIGFTKPDSCGLYQTEAQQRADASKAMRAVGPNDHKWGR